MKAKDVQVGTEYAYQRGYAPARRVVAVRTGVVVKERWPERGFTGTEVRFLDYTGRGDQGKEVRVVPNRHLTSRWDAYVAERDERRRVAARAAEASEKAQAHNLLTAKAVAVALDERGVRRPLGLDDHDLGLTPYYEGATLRVGHDVRRGEFKVSVRWLAEVLGVPGYETAVQGEEE